MEKSLKEKFADLFDATEYENSPYCISMTKLFIWLTVMTVLSSLTPFISSGGSPLFKTFASLAILLFITARPAFRWIITVKK